MTTDASASEAFALVVEFDFLLFLLDAEEENADVEPEGSSYCPAGAINNAPSVENASLRKKGVLSSSLNMT